MKWSEFVSVKILHIYFPMPEQVQAIQRGLLQVVPQAVLEMLTWHEFEKRVCGDPEISMEALRNYSKYLLSRICIHVSKPRLLCCCLGISRCGGM